MWRWSGCCGADLKPSDRGLVTELSYGAIANGAPSMPGWIGWARCLREAAAQVALAFARGLYQLLLMDGFPIQQRQHHVELAKTSKGWGGWPL